MPAYLITIIGLLPVSGIIDFYYQSFSNVADRYFYISMFGLIILIGNGLVRLKKTNLKYIIVLIVGIFLSYQTTSFSNTWVNELSLWNRVIEHNPEASFLAYLGRGEYYLVNSSYSNAIMDFTKAVELNKNEYRCYYNRANAYLDLKQYDKAVRDYSRALLLNPKDVNAWKQVAGYSKWALGEREPKKKPAIRKSRTPSYRGFRGFKTPKAP